MAPIVFPAVERAQLSNGLKVVLVPRPGTTTDSVLLRFDDAGLAGPSRVIAPVALDLLAGKGTTPDQRARAERIELLNGWINRTTDLDHADLSIGWAAKRLAGGVAFLGDVLTRPGITPDAVAALKKAGVEQLGARSSNSYALADRALFNAIYGAGHPYSPAPDVATDIKAMDAVDPAALQEWYRGHLRPDRATLYIAADTNMAVLKPLLDKALAGWIAMGPAAAAPAIPPAQGTATPSLTVIDKPGAAQTFIMAGKVIPAATPGSPEGTATWTVNEVYGGNSTARIGSNLRVAKGWTYGIGSGLYDTRGQRRWILAGSVSREHSGDSVAELIKEMRGLTGEHPPEERELTRIATSVANQSAAKLEGNADLLEAMADAESDGLPQDDVVRAPVRLQALTLAQLRGATAALSDPDTVHWVLVGDWQRIRDQFTNLKIGTPVVISTTR
jgi:predicted Zn-dependent peptidase